ncbi:hypothetical protein BX257_7214 [Streptomyces sp. 3212.3]|nr:hypothetical protein BX257_7214 [Streptomyces sp. 3212.3]
MIAAYDAPPTAHGLVLVAVMAGGWPAVISLCVYLVASVPRLRRRAARERWRDVAIVFATAALALYVWACSRIYFLYGHEGGVDCFTLDDLRRGTKLDGVSGSFTPLQLTCHMSDGHSLDIIVPGYLNPTIAVLLLLGLVCVLRWMLLRRTVQRKVGS